MARGKPSGVGVGDGERQDGDKRLLADMVRGAGLTRSGVYHVDHRTIADCGHYAMDEQPEAVASVIREFALGAGLSSP